MLEFETNYSLNQQVHFGHDSILQTPNIKQAKKKMGDTMPIKEDLENVTKGKHRNSVSF